MLLKTNGWLFLEMKNQPEFAGRGFGSQRETAYSPARVDMAATEASCDTIRGVGLTAEMNQGNARRLQNSGNKAKMLLKTNGWLFLEMKNQPEFAGRGFGSQRETACSPTMVGMAATEASHDTIRGTGLTAEMNQGNAGRLQNSRNKARILLKIKDLLFLEVKNEANFVRSRYLPNAKTAPLFAGVAKIPSG